MSPRYGEAGTWRPASLADAERAATVRRRLGPARAVPPAERGSDFPAALELAGRALAVIGDDPETADLRLLLLSGQVVALGDMGRDADAAAA